MTRSQTLLSLALLGAVSVVSAQNGNRDGSFSPNTINVPQNLAPDAVFTEGFAVTGGGAAGESRVCPNTIPGFNGSNWFAINNSFGPGNVAATGTSCIFQGNTAVFNAHAGPADSYLGLNFNSTTGANTVNTWVVTPRLNFAPNGRVEFFMRTGTASAFPDRVQIRVSTAADTGTPDTGTTSDSVGTFTTLLADINPTLLTTDPAGCPAGVVISTPGQTVTGFPNTNWCRFQINASAGLPATGSGRIAFRYFVPNGGPAGANSNFIGIDSLTLDEGLANQPPVESNAVNTMSVYGLGALGLLLAGAGFIAVRRYA